MRARLFGFLALCAVVAAVVVFAAVFAGGPRLVVENRSGHAIETLRIGVGRGGDGIELAGVADGASVERGFRVAREGAFVVSGRLDDGSELAGEFGYATPALEPERVVFVVGEGGEITFVEQ